VHWNFKNPVWLHPIHCLIGRVTSVSNVFTALSCLCEPCWSFARLSPLFDVYTWTGLIAVSDTCGLSGKTVVWCWVGSKQLSANAAKGESKASPVLYSAPCRELVWRMTEVLLHGFLTSSVDWGEWSWLCCMEGRFANHYDWKDCARKRCWRNLRHCTGIFRELVRKVTKRLKVTRGLAEIRSGSLPHTSQKRCLAHCVDYDWCWLKCAAGCVCEPKALGFVGLNAQSSTCLSSVCSTT
jgi:hypothetical protein